MKRKIFRPFFFLSFINYFHIYPKHALSPNLNFSAIVFAIQEQILTLVIISQLILLCGQSRNRYASSQQHQTLYREPVEIAGSSYQDWEIGYAMRSSRNISLVSSPGVAHMQSSPFLPSLAEHSSFTKRKRKLSTPLFSLSPF